MASGFSVVIAASDKSTAVIDKINKRFVALTAPIQRVNKSLGRLSDTSGFTAVASGVWKVGTGLLRAASSAAKAVGPIGAITSAVSVAGVVRLTNSFADFGTRLGMNADAIGTSAGQLQALQYAARRTGASAEDMAGSLSNLGQAATDAAGGQNQTALGYFRQMGIEIRKTNGQVKSAVELLPEVANAAEKLKDNPALQNRLFAAWGISPDLRILLNGGAPGLAKLTGMAGKFGLFTDKDLGNARTMHGALTDLTAGVESFGNRIGSKLAPVLGPMLTQLGEWIERKAPGVATAVERIALAFGSWVDNGGFERMLVRVEALVRKIASLLDLVLPADEGGGPVRRPGETPFSKLITSIDQPPGLLPTGQRSEALAREYNLRPGLHIRSSEFDPKDDAPTYQPAGLAPDVEAEVRKNARLRGLDEEHMVRLARAEGGGYRNVSPAGAVGPMQLMLGTADDLTKTGPSVDVWDWRQNVEGGVRYYKQQLDRFHGNYRAADAAYNAGPNNPGVQNFANTQDISGLPDETKKYIRTINGPGALIPRPLGATGEPLQPATAAPAPGAPGASGSVKVEVTLKGAPLGTTAATTTSGNVSASPARIEGPRLMGANP